MLSPTQATRIALPLKAQENTATKIKEITRTAMQTAKNFLVMLIRP